MGTQSAPGTQGVLVVDALLKSFGGVRAVDHASFRVDEGEVVALVGPNGAGKTTCLHMISGTMRPDSGSISLRAKPLGGMSASSRYWHGMRRTFQHPVFPADVLSGEWLAGDRAFHRLHGRGYRHHLNDQFLGGVTGRESEHLPHGGRFRKRHRSSDPHRHGGEDIERLSPGQRHLLEILRVCSGEPTLLLLDEPTSGMDVADVEIFSVMLRSAATAGCSVLLVTHDVPLAVRLADRMVVMNFGKVIADGEPRAVLRQPDVVDSYLGRRSARLLLGIDSDQAAAPPADEALT